MKIRDIIALPFAMIGFIFIILAVEIGSDWTALQVIKHK